MQKSNPITSLEFMLANMDLIDFEKWANHMVEVDAYVFHDRSSPDRYVHVVDEDAYTNLTAAELFNEYAGLMDDYHDSITTYIIKECMDI